MSLLRRGMTLVRNVSERRYEITSYHDEGGFGEIYRGIELDRKRNREVAIKVSPDAKAWHGEAYFGRLLEGQPHVVGFRDAFPLIQASGGTRSVKYVLALDWIAGGTVYNALNKDMAAWPSKRRNAGSPNSLGYWNCCIRGASATGT